MKVFFFLLIFAPLCYPQICEIQFLRSHYAANAKVVEKATVKALDELFAQTRKAKTLESKMEFLEEQYDIVANLYSNKFEKAKALIDEKNLPAEEASKLLSEKQLEIVDELKLYPNRIINEAQKIFQEAGIPVNLKFKKVTDDIRYKYLELGEGESASSMAAQKIQKYKDRFGTETVTFDLYQNLINGSAGFSIAEMRRIDLGIGGMRNLLVDDLITMVGKHEFHHAAFAAKRADNVSSIYHGSYVVNGDKPLSSVANGYNQFMSAEELYNWANNSFWASARFSNISKYNPKDYLNDLQGIYNYLGGTKKIAAQTQEITENFNLAIKQMRKEIKDGEFELIFLTENKTMAESVEEAYHLVIVDEKNMHMMFEFAGPEYADDVAGILNERMKLTTKYTQELPKKHSRKAFEKMRKKLIKEENEISGERFLNVLETLEGKHQTLNKVAMALEKETDMVMSKTESFIEKLNKALETNKDALKNPVWKEEFQSLAQEYRKLGNLVKEDYKGFAGR